MFWSSVGVQQNISEKINQLYLSLIKDFGIRKPKIAVLALNPHAGDNGAIGNEEKEIIIPAIEKTKINGLTFHKKLFLKKQFIPIHKKQLATLEFFPCRYNWK